MANIIFEQKHAETGLKLWQHLFPVDPVPELPGGPLNGDIRATYSVAVPNTGERVKYHTTWLHLQHREFHADGALKHDFITAVRFFIQVYGPSLGRIVDQNMPELQPQGVVPYPYERDVTNPVNHIHPGAEFEIVHQRDPAVYGVDEELLWPINFPAQDEHPSVKWWYQGGAVVIGEYDGKAFVRAILSSAHPRYAVRVRGVPSRIQ